MEEDALSPSATPNNIVDFVTQRALTDVSSTYDDENHDPDKAAKAIQLSRTTGVPAAVIHEDQDHFMHEGKQALAKGIVSNNPYIQDYIMAHPLAAKVSSDDWGPLDEAMGVGLKHATKSILQKVAEGFKEGSAYENIDEGLAKFDNLMASNPLYMGAFYEYVLRHDVHDIGKVFATINGVFHAASGGLGEALAQSGAPDWLMRNVPGIGDPMLTGEAGKNRLVRDILVGLQTSLSGQESPAGPGIKPRADALQQFRKEVGDEIQKTITVTDANGRVYPPQLIKPYLEAGEEPPVGVHPEIDKIKEDQSGLDAKWVQEFDSAIQKTATHGRSPEMAELAVRQVVGDQTIELDARAIRKIYGDKPPTLDDGLLGWIPGVGDQLRLAEQTGGDIEVPLAGWIARVDPEIKRELKDFIRVRPEGIAPIEKELNKSYEEAVKSPMPAKELSDSDLRDSNFTESEIRDRGISKQMLEEAAQGFMYKEGGWTKVTQEDIDKLRAKVEKAAPEKQAILEKLEAAIKSGDQQAVRKLMPGDFGGRDIDVYGFEGAARRSAVRRFENDENALKQMQRVFQRGQEGTKSALPKDTGPLSSGDHIVDGIRSAAGLDSMFDPARLQKLILEGDLSADEKGQREFDLKDTTGRRVGSLTISEKDGGKNLVVEWLGAGPSLGPKDFATYTSTPGFLGPRVLRDLLTQIKNEYPNAETLTGKRVSGARAGPATTKDVKDIHPKDLPDTSISLKSPSALSNTELTKLGEQIFQMLHTPEEAIPLGEWRDFGADTQGFVQPKALYTQYQQQLTAEVGRLLDRIVPKAVQVHEVGDIRDTETGAKAAGMYIRNVERQGDSLILWSLTEGDPVGTARHEAIHHLRQMGFFSDKEWQTLEAAADRNKWMDRWGIRERWKGFPQVDLMEETIAEAYRKWGHNPRMVDESIHPLMQKIKDLLDQIKAIVKDILGTTSAHDIFMRVEKGEVGTREPRRVGAEGLPEPDLDPADIVPVHARSALPKEPELPQAGTTRMEDRKPITGKAINLSEKAMNSILQAIEDRANADWEKNRDKLEKDELRRQSKEWKDNSAAMREEVEKQVYQRADIGADQLLRKGMLDGIRVKGKIPKIDPQFLTPAQRARLPKDYFAAKGEGFNIDDFARLFKFDSGDALVERLALLEQGRKQSGLEGKAFIDRLVKDTTELRMEEKYGDQKANAIQEARDKFIGDKDLRVIHETILGIQEAIGDQRTITKEKLEQGILEDFNRKTASQVKAKKDLRDSGKLDKAATVELFVNKNPAGWLSNKMAQYRAIYDHGLSTKLEKEYNKFQDTLKNLKSPSSDTMDQAYRNIIHTVMEQIGERPNRRPGDLQESLDKINVGTNLAEFKLKTFDSTWGMDDLQIPDFLTPNFRKPLDELTVEEFRGVKNVIDALATKGRATHTFEIAGERVKKEKVIDELIEGRVDRFPFKPHEMTPSRSSRLLKLPRQYLANSTSFETFARRMDQQDPYGPWMRYLMYPLAKAANTKDVLIRWGAGQLAKVGPITKPDKLLERPPLGIEVSNFTVDNLQNMIHNMGNEAQWDHFARGWGADPQVLKQWVFTQAAHLDAIKKGWGKELFDRAQRLGDHVWDETFSKAQAEYMDIYGNFPEKIGLKPIQTPYGEAKGWYHPQIPDAKQKVIFDKDGKIISKQSDAQGEPSLYENNDNFHARTFNGYTKKRTGAFYPMSMDSNMIPVRLSQMLHDIAFRKTLIEAEKLLGSKRLQEAVSHHYGDEYAKSFMPYLRGIAGQEGIPSEAWSDFKRLSGFVRDNVISSYIAFNPYTAAKHGPGALLMSMFQVGVAPFARFRRPFAMSEQAPKEWLEAAKDLYGHQMDMNLTNKEFVDKWSEEVGRRRRFWIETIGGQTKLNNNQVGMFSSAFSRENIIQKGSWLVAQSDMFSVRPTWLAAYRKAMLDTKNDHGLSVSVADAAVRLQHGSTAVTNFPAIVRDSNNWFTAIYGFWGTIMQRRIEMAHQIADTYRMDISDKQFGQMYKNSAQILAKTMIYFIAPAVIEEGVTGLTAEDRRGFGERLIDAAIHGLGASEVGIRDIGQLFKGHVSIGLISSFLEDTQKTLNSLKKGTEMFSRKHAGETVQNVMTTFGQLRGVHPRAFSNVERYGLDLFTEEQNPPEEVGELTRGITRGKSKARIIK